MIFDGLCAAVCDCVVCREEVQYCDNNCEKYVSLWEANNHSKSSVCARGLHIAFAYMLELRMGACEFVCMHVRLPFRLSFPRALFFEVFRFSGASAVNVYDYK